MLRYDSPIMETLSTVADYVLLNLLCLILCLPVVTIGAAMTAKYAVSMKIARGEEPPIFSSFFSSFRNNFPQSTFLWALLAGALGFLGADWYLIRKDGSESWPVFFLVLLGFATYVVLGTFFSVFPMIARFQMKNRDALKGAVVFSLIHIPRVLLAIVMMGLPYLICLWYIKWALAIWLFCTGVMLYYNSRFFVKEFKKVEEAALGAPQEAS